MSFLKTYDPGQVVVNVGGRDITGFADGTFVKVERNADAFSLTIGADGEATRVKSRNRSGRFTFTLQQSSPSNDILTAVANKDEVTNTGVVPVMVKDANGTTLASAAKAWSVKKASAEFGKDASSREWIFETHQLDLTIGGNLDA